MKIFIILSMLFGTSVFAQVPNFEMRIRNLEQKTFQLEQQNLNLQRRVWELERFVYNNPPQPPPAPVPNGVYVCSSEHSISQKVYIGKSRSKIEAEAIAQNSCVNSNVNSQHCIQSECSVEGFAIHTCRITHSVNKKDYVGQAKSITEAKAIARNNCAGSNINPQYCDVQSLFCD